MPKRKPFTFEAITLDVVKDMAEFVQIYEICCDYCAENRVHFEVREDNKEMIAELLLRHIDSIGWRSADHAYGVVCAKCVKELSRTES